MFSGSISSGGAGMRAVFTAQNWQPLVQVSPGRAPQDRTVAKEVMRDQTATERSSRLYADDKTMYQLPTKPQEVYKDASILPRWPIKSEG